MTIDYYRGMLTQRTRVEAFRRAIQATVRPGDRVLEIGPGLGTFAFFAADAGAKKVWAVEGDAVISVAKSIARVNHYGDRVEFLRGWYPSVEIPEPIDVLIFEDYPARLIDSWTYGVLKRLHADVVRPETRVVPKRARMFLAPVFSTEAWQVVGPLDAETDVAYGVDWFPSRSYACNMPMHMPLRGEDLRHEPRVVADIRLDRVPDVAELAGDAVWEFAAETQLHGLAYWFDFEVGDDEWLSNAPGGDPRSWGHLYLPIPEVLTVPAGGRLEAAVAPEVAQDGSPSWLTWRVRSGEEEFSGHEFKSFPAQLSDVVSSSASWVPELHANAEVERRILALADGKRTVDQIAAEIRGTTDAEELEEARNLVLNTLAGRTKVTARAVTR